MYQKLCKNLATDIAATPAVKIKEQPEKPQVPVAVVTLTSPNAIYSYKILSCHLKGATSQRKSEQKTLPLCIYYQNQNNIKST